MHCIQLKSEVVQLLLLLLLRHVFGEFFWIPWTLRYSLDILDLKVLFWMPLTLRCLLHTLDLKVSFVFWVL